jgi:hypothetical protein
MREFCPGRNSLTVNVSKIRAKISISKSQPVRLLSPRNLLRCEENFVEFTSFNFDNASFGQFDTQKSTILTE